MRSNISLVNTFPEIECFFNKYRFSDHELDQLKESIRIKYPDKTTQKAAFSLINLEISKKFYFEEIIGSKRGLIKKEAIIPKNKKVALIPTEAKLQKDTAKTTFNEFDIAGKLNSLKNLKISSIAQKTDWPTSSLRNLLKQKGILKTKDNYLTEKEFKLIKEILGLRLRGLHNSERSIAYFQNATKSCQETNHSYNFDDVYSKIRRYGLGKVIYIRKS